MQFGKQSGRLGGLRMKSQVVYDGVYWDIGLFCLGQGVASSNLDLALDLLNGLSEGRPVHHVGFTQQDWQRIRLGGITVFARPVKGPDSIPANRPLRREQKVRAIALP